MISIQNIWKSFGSQLVLGGISLDIEPGKTTTIVGPSGVGKSVLLKLIMGIISPDSGKIFIGKDEITALKRESQKNKVRSQLGTLFQSAALFDSITIYENIAFPLEQHGGLSRTEIRNRVLAMLESLSLEPYALRFPQEVSIGIRKRAGMARALVTEPKILLVDEPNTGLDPLVGQEVYDLIKECQVKWNLTGVVISHELPEVFQVSHRVAMILNGTIVEEGTPEEFTKSTNPAVEQFLNGRKDGPIKIK